MDIIKINKKKISVAEDAEKLEFLLVEMQNGASTMENSMAIPKKQELPYDPAFLFLCMFPKEFKVGS